MEPTTIMVAQAGRQEQHHGPGDSLELSQVPSTTGEPPVVSNPEVLEDGGDGLSRVSSGPVYTTFSQPTRVWITVMVTFASFVSPVTANIYFPALNPIAESLGVSTSLVNLSLTTFMVFQGLAPPFFGDCGDKLGRRPAYIVAFTIYIAANIGLALQRTYAGLLVLRCLQSAGSSGTLALGYAAVADITTTGERGKYMGFVGAGVNIGPALGPFLGGVLSQYLGWPSIFWFCAIFAVTWLIPWTLAVPETSRNVVGNGSIPPQPWNYTILDLIRRRKLAHQRDEGLYKRRKLTFPNPLQTLVIVFEKETSLLLTANTIIYLAFILVAATLSTLFREIYRYNDLVIGLCYLPYGGGAVVATVCQGYAVDWNYRRIAKRLGMTINRRKGDDLSNFPIESARIQLVYPMLLLGVGALVGWGWTLQMETMVAGPLVLLFLVGFFVPTSFSALQTLIIDLHPEAPASATAAMNLVRCIFGAVATAVVEQMLSAMGRGWCFTFLALLIVGCLPILRMVEKRGPRWRAETRAKKERRDGDCSEAQTHAQRERKS